VVVFRALLTYASQISLFFTTRLTAAVPIASLFTTLLVCAVGMAAMVVAIMMSVAPTVPIAPAPSGRFTALHCAAYNGRTKSAVALLVGGADRTVTNKQG
jgi:hypothetical protein